MKITSNHIYSKKAKGEKLVCLSAYDYPTARLADEEKTDIVLVGDSLAMVVLGQKNTTQVTMEEMIHHTKAVSRAVKNAMIVGDMPIGSYDTVELAIENAKRFLNEGKVDGVKLEGGLSISKQVDALVAAKIPVMGHVGMLPQSAHQVKDYKVKGKDNQEADKIARDAQFLDQAGAFSIVLECIPADLAGQITEKVKAPTIGIGAGVQTDGQILVLLDLLGIRGSVQPKFVRQYASLEETIKKAIAEYRQDVLKGHFPSDQESY